VRRLITDEMALQCYKFSAAN